MVDLAASETIVAEPLAATQTRPDQQSICESTVEPMAIPTDCRKVADIAACCALMTMVGFYRIGVNRLQATNVRFLGMGGWLS
jgi:hypothetical protein